MSNFDPTQLKIVIEDQGFKDDITPEGLKKKRFFNAEIENNSNFDINWIRFEIICTYVNSKEEKIYSSIIVDGNTRGSSSKYLYKTFYWHKFGFPIENLLKKGEKIKYSDFWLDIPSENPDECQGVELYEYFGETSDGNKFHKLTHNKIQFNSNGYASEVTSEKISLCFVVTAAYGDQNHPIVQTFRIFRDTILTKYSIGKRFIKWYYKIGPILADKISGHKLICYLLRSVLTPLAFFIKFLGKNSIKNERNC